jgi:hypothetical protein
MRILMSTRERFAWLHCAVATDALIGRLLLQQIGHYSSACSGLCVWWRSEWALRSPTLRKKDWDPSGILTGIPPGNFAGIPLQPGIPVLILPGQTGVKLGSRSLFSSIAADCLHIYCIVLGVIEDYHKFKSPKPGSHFGSRRDSAIPPGSFFHPGHIFYGGDFFRIGWVPRGLLPHLLSARLCSLNI